MDNIHPEFHRMLGRADKEALLKQQSAVFWLYGLSGSGKSTIANAFERELNKMGYMTQILDGDNIRTGLNSNLGFTDDDRAENIRRIAEVAKLYGEKGEIAWGSQIRSYVLQPYQMVKDHRTDIQTGNVEAVLNGDLDAFIEGYLRHRAKNRTGKD